MGFPGMPNFMPNPNMENFQQVYDMKNMKGNQEENSQGFYNPGGYTGYFNKQQ